MDNKNLATYTDLCHQTQWRNGCTIVRFQSREYQVSSWSLFALIFGDTGNLYVVRSHGMFHCKSCLALASICEQHCPIIKKHEMACFQDVKSCWFFYRFIHCIIVFQVKWSFIFLSCHCIAINYLWLTYPIKCWWCSIGKF